MSGIFACSELRDDWAWILSDGPVPIKKGAEGLLDFIGNPQEPPGDPKIGIQNILPLDNV